MPTAPLRQAVIMAAGLGTRLRPLTYATPKPLLPVAGRPILEWTLTALPAAAEEVLIVVGYKKGMIMEHLGDEWQGRRLKYVEQAELKGSGHALFACREHLRDRFLVVNGDDLYGAADLARLAEHNVAILAKRLEAPGRFGSLQTDADGRLVAIIENTDASAGALINVGAYVLDTDVFNYELVPIHDGREFGLPQTIVSLAQDRPVDIVTADFWMPVGTPEDLARANKVLSAL